MALVINLDFKEIHKIQINLICWVAFFGRKTLPRSSHKWLSKREEDILDCRNIF